MGYNPLSKEKADEMARPPLIDDGQYQFELMEFHNTDKYHNKLVDSKGGEMTRIKIKIWDHHNKERFVFTNLYWSDENKMAYRTRHFAETIDMLPLYEGGSLYDEMSQCLGKTGYCEIYTQKAKPKNDGTNEMWAPKNDVRDFIVADKVPEDAKTMKADPTLNDDLPF